MLTNVPIDADITVSATWANLIDPLRSRVGQAVSLAAERCEGLPAVAFPVGYRELARVFPSIWSSEIKSRHSILDDTGGSPEKVPLIQMILLFGNGVPYLVTYRRVGQKGKSSRAIVFLRQNPEGDHSHKVVEPSRLDLICQSALEGVVGPVGWFDVQLYPGIKYDVDFAPPQAEVQQ